MQRQGRKVVPILGTQHFVSDLERISNDEDSPRGQFDCRHGWKVIYKALGGSEMIDVAWSIPFVV